MCVQKQFTSLLLGIVRVIELKVSHLCNRVSAVKDRRENLRVETPAKYEREILKLAIKSMQLRIECALALFRVHLAFSSTAFYRQTKQACP